MTSTDPGNTPRLPVDPGLEMRSGGAILFFGTLFFMITIGFELAVGWPPPEGGRGADTGAVILQLWPSLRWIWSAQMLGGFLFALSAVLLLRSRHLETRWPAASVLWSAVAIGGLLVTVAYGLTLGCYPPALWALEESPELFATVRGGVRVLYVGGLGVVLLGYLVLFLREGIVRGGVVPPSWMIGAIVAIVVAILGGASGLLRSATAGAVGFVVPGLLGLSLWRAGRRLAR